MNSRSLTSRQRINSYVTSTKRKTTKKTKVHILPNKYELYEASVQDAADDASILEELYRKIRGKKPKSFREDFCGTFKIACEWVKLDRTKTAIGLDIDPEPLQYGRTRHYPRLNEDQKGRIKILQQNVKSVTRPGSDLIAACNFSWFILKKRKELIEYFKFVRKSLNETGLFFMDIVGGTEMIETHTDKEKYGRGKKSFQYIWKQEDFNPINNEGFFSISYKLADGTKLKRAFTYDWRVWNIQEVRECLAEAGFKNSYVFWEMEDKDGRGTGEFKRSEKEEQCAVWIAYIIGSKI